ncbi:MAG: hypothetical protein CMJ34_08015 [Phycisphaerae bacterium]|nr:hypothetical protein [Phycisphaerae bacterium]
MTSDASSGRREDGRWNARDPLIEEILLDETAMRVIDAMQSASDPVSLTRMAEHAEAGSSEVSSILGRLIAADLARFHPSTRKSPGGYELTTQFPEIVSEIGGIGDQHLMSSHRELRTTFIDRVLATHAIGERRQVDSFRWMEEQVIVGPEDMDEFRGILDQVNRLLMTFRLRTVRDPGGEGNRSFAVRFRVIETEPTTARLGAVHSVLAEEDPKIIKERLPSPPLPLTPRQEEIAELVADGLTNQEIASQLGVTGNTVKSTLRRVYEALEISRRTELAELITTRRRGH